MHYPHRIRLRGPWHCTPLAHTVLHADGRVETVEALPPVVHRVTMPCRWHETSLGAFVGRVRCERSFGYPGRIDPHEHVWLTFAGADGFATVWLNGHELGGNRGSSDPFEFEVTSLLRPRNLLVVEIDSPAPHAGNGGLWGEVAMEIRAEVFLRGLRTWAMPADGAWRLHVVGEVVGQTDLPLELSVTVAGRVLLHEGGVQASPEGIPFAETVMVPEGTEPRAIVEVVGGARCLYSVVCVFTC